MGQLRERTVAGLGGVGHGLGRLGRRSRDAGVVVGECREVVVEAAGVDRLDRLGHPAVERHPPHGVSPS